MNFTKNRAKLFHEFNIPVAWGHIAVKAWGTADDPHVLVIHGFTDNAGSFDNLIPLLPHNFYYICIDLPGHGRSSHFPLLMPIYSLNYVIVIKHVIDYFGKEKYILIGHSSGGEIGFWITRMYPNHIEKLVTIEGAHFPEVLPKDAVKYVKEKFEKNIELQNIANRRKTYRYPEIAQIISNSRRGGDNLTKESVEPLLKRCLEPADNGEYHLTTDLRVTAILNSIHDENYTIQLLRLHEFSCPVLVIFGKMNFIGRKNYLGTCKQLFNMKNVTVVHVDGYNDIHNNNPEIIVPHIKHFLLQSISKM